MLFILGLGIFITWFRIYNEIQVKARQYKEKSDLVVYRPVKYLLSLNKDFYPVREF